ncbi:MAG: hypothetical protein ACLGIE_14060 [Alphaproteobacteria bacterium]
MTRCRFSLLALASRMDPPIRSRQIKLLAQALLQNGYRPMLITSEREADLRDHLSAPSEVLVWNGRNVALSGLLLAGSTP